jgi:opacity protein-like surface antigen
MLVDVVFRYDKPQSKWVPYAGAGAGGDASIIELDHIRAPNGTVVDGDGSTVVFAWQLFAGVRYKFNDMMSIGAGYKYYSVDGASWDVSHTSGDIESGTARIHSVGVNFNMKF